MPPKPLSCPRNSSSSPDLLHEIEDANNYVQGGYHPVDIGDVICAGDRHYEVLHKLGHGGYSTIWLVQPRENLGTFTYYALKIIRADCGDIDVLNESRILQHLNRVGGPGHPNIINIHDTFNITGPNGEHTCLLLPVLGPRMENYDVAKAVPSAVRHQVCQQVASAVAFLHSNGVCHGDLTDLNIVFELPDLSSVSPEDLYHILGPIKTERPQLFRDTESPHPPKRMVEAANFSGLDFSTLTKIRLIDFGESFFTDQPPSSLGAPIDFFPPEICFGYTPSPKSDVWSLACVLYSVETSSFLFPTGFRIFGILVGTIVGYLGPLPEQWKGKFMNETYGYRENGVLKHDTEPPWWYTDEFTDKSIADRLSTEAPHLSNLQREQFLRLIQEMVVYEPDERVSSVDVARRLRDLIFQDEET